MVKKTLEQWLLWMEEQHPKDIEMGLDRVSKALNRLDIKFSAPVVTVAGTNGKGSCIFYFEQLCISHGLSVGSYTSPHIFVYNERVKINGAPASDSALCEVIEKVSTITKDIPLTYFEISALSSLLLLSKQPLDIIILEVGLGGRLDAVNAIDCDVAVITSIDFDHQEYLGDTLDKIGYEKAGIARSEKPCFLGCDMPASVFEHLASINAKTKQIAKNFSFRNQIFEWHDFPNQKVQVPPTSLHENSVALSLAVFHSLFTLYQESVRHLTSLNFPGRWQKVRNEPEIIADVAHNPAAMENLAKKLHGSKKQTSLLLGMLADKDSLNSIRYIVPYITKYYICPLETIRSQKTEILHRHLINLGVDESSIICSNSVKAALAEALKDTDANERLLITGSFFTVSQSLTLLRE